MSSNRNLPGHYLIAAARSLGASGPKSAPRTVLVEAMPFWGHYRVTFTPTRSPQGNWQWVVSEQTQVEPPLRPYLAGLVEVFGRASP
ncbi:MAG: hypothetical protein AB7G13_28115 [Lautropia sp.]